MSGLQQLPQVSEPDLQEQLAAYFHGVEALLCYVVQHGSIDQRAKDLCCALAAFQGTVPHALVLADLPRYARTRVAAGACVKAREVVMQAVRARLRHHQPQQPLRGAR